MKSMKSLLSGLVLALALSASAYAQQKVNINTADAATLDRVLVNIGASKAQAIVVHRKQHGAFKSADELATVKGIGLKTVEKNRDRITLRGAAPAKSAQTKAAPTAARKLTVAKR